MIQTKWLRRMGCALVCLGMLATGCKVSQQSGKQPTVYTNKGRSTEAVLSSLLESQKGWNSVKATLRAEITFGKRTFSSRINLQAIRGEGIRLSIVPFPLVEAARVWITTDHIVVVDLINGVYAQLPYADLKDKFAFTPTYEQMEALLMGQVFDPEGDLLTLEALRRLAAHREPHGGFILKGGRGSHKYEFAVNSSCQISHFAHKDRQGARQFVASYDGRSKLTEETTLPELTKFEVHASSGQLSAPRGGMSLEWQRISAVPAEELNVRPLIKPQYKRLTLEHVLRVLDSL